MPALQVRDFPPELYEELKACAEREHRSIAQQTVVAVEAYVHGEAKGSTSEVLRTQTTYEPFSVIQGEGLTRAERRRRVLERIKRMPKDEIPGDYPDDAEIVRQCREERDRQLMALEGFDVDEGEVLQ